MEKSAKALNNERGNSLVQYSEARRAAEKNTADDLGFGFLPSPLISLMLMVLDFSLLNPFSILPGSPATPGRSLRKQVPKPADGLSRDFIPSRAQTTINASTESTTEIQVF